MPNIKSAKKRVIVNNKKTEQNKNIRSEVRSEIKKVQQLIKDNKLDEAKSAINEAFAIIDSAASKNIIHANNAANKKAKLSKKIDAALKNASVAPAAPVAEEVKEEVKAEVKVEEPAPVKKPAAKKSSAKKAAEAKDAE